MSIEFLNFIAALSIIIVAAKASGYISFMMTLASMVERSSPSKRSAK